MTPGRHGRQHLVPAGLAPRDGSPIVLETFQNIPGALGLLPLPRLAGPDTVGPMNQFLGSSITYRIAVGPHAGRKVFTPQTLPASDPDEHFTDTLGEVTGFSLHAGAAAKAQERNKLQPRTHLPPLRRFQEPCVTSEAHSLLISDRRPAIR